jgi:hypothetical protein
MGLWSWLRDVDERVGLRPRRGPFDCAWCVREEHDGCTGVAIRTRLPGWGPANVHRMQAEDEACACRAREHRPVG